jgi:hypothetical protein
MIWVLMLIFFKQLFEDTHDIIDLKGDIFRFQGLENRLDEREFLVDCLYLINWQRITSHMGDDLGLETP